MATQAPEIPQIQTTKEYAIFKLMAGNRAVDYNHVKRLKREMQANPHLFASNPISVNENMYIIDGQHRRQAAQELNIPVCYIITPGIKLDETRSLNVTQRRWQLLDFARSYAETGHKDYTTFLHFVKQYPKIAPGILRTYLAGGQRHQLDVDFRRGEFQVKNADRARENLDKLNTIAQKTGMTMATPMSNALLQLFEDKTGKGADPFDYELFVQKLDREAARELFEATASIRGCLRSIENVYNFQSKAQKRLY
ncbi:MAG: ParB N-terminal domain-containing protein [Candidatus Saccharimonadales bacterium]